MVTHESLIDLVFAKCSLVYGRDFLSRWEGLDLDEVKADWCRELGNLMNAPAAIRHGLERLPADKPPTVLQFRALCIGAPGDQHSRPALLDGPSASPAVVAAVKRIGLGPKSDVDPKAWAWALRKREMECARLSSAQRSMWREALQTELAARVAA